jgi:hypothetical protein
VTRTTIRRVAGLAVGVLVFAAGVYVVRVASILAAYKAKMLCSEVFLAGRDADDVERELEVDDLRSLRFISDSIDRNARRVTSRVAGIILQDAAYREDGGCAVGADPVTNQAMHRTWFPVPKPVVAGRCPPPLA